MSRMHQIAVSGLLLAGMLLCFGTPVLSSPPSEGAMKRAVDEVYWLLLTGAEAHEKGDFQKAREAYRAAYDLAVRLGDDSGVGIAAESVGKTYSAQAAHGDAVTWYRRAVTAYGRIPLADWLMAEFGIEVYESLGRAYEHLGKPADAIRTYADGVARAKQLLPRIPAEHRCFTLKAIAYLSRALADLHYETGSSASMDCYAEAVRYAGQAADCYQGNGQRIEDGEDAFILKWVQIMAAWQLGIHCFRFEEYSRGLASFEEALALWHTPGIHDPGTTIVVDLLLGIAYGHLKTGRAALARARLRDARTHDTELDWSKVVDKSSAAFATSVAMELYEIKEYDEAAYWFARSGTALERMGLRDLTAMARHMQGLSLANAARWREAVSPLEVALDLFLRDDRAPYAREAAEWLSYVKCQIASGLHGAGQTRVAATAMTRGVSERNCPVDEVRAVSSSEERIVCWVAMDGQVRGSRLQFVFLQPGGTVYHRGEVDAQWPLHWYWLWIRGYATADLPGTWTTKVFLDGQLVAEHRWELQRP